ncbi:hypothetical protein UlMin_013951 [Ulmus minor]
MENLNEFSSSFSFASSSYVSNGSSSHNVSASASSEPALSLETLSLTKLSSNLEKLLIDSEFGDYTDAEIVVEGVPVGVHRCILAARSQYFHELFKKGNGGSSKEGKPRYLMSELVPHGEVGYEAFIVFLNYLYTGTGKLKPSPPEISTCVDDTCCAHDACRPAINYAVELMYASYTFQMKELVLLVQRRLLNFVEKAFVEDVIPILKAAFYCQLNQLLPDCIQRIAQSNLDDVSLEKELPYEVYTEIKSIRLKSLQEAQQEDETSMMEIDQEQEKRIRRIHRALDSDDVELVTLLLDESDDISLDDACALHYAVAYCDAKVVKEVLALNSADLNHRNPRGHTVLHVAARRKEPSIIAALIDRGVSALETTEDGQTAVSICRRLTRPKDYHEKTPKGKESNKDRICIDVLEREMRKNSMSGIIFSASQITHEDLNAKLSYFENRVDLARLFFPAEARLAMEMAEAHSTYRGLSRSTGSSGNLREVDLNETPSVQTRRLRSKLLSLIKTVEKGRQYFPHCSEVLDKFLDDEVDMPDTYFFENGTPDEQAMKKMRFMELKEEVQKAFSKDMAENNQSGLSSSSSSTSQKEAAKRKARKKSN